MNQLKVDLKQAIVALAGKKWSKRRVARELGVDRGSVRRYWPTSDSKPAISTSGSDDDPGSKPPTISTLGFSEVEAKPPTISIAGSIDGFKPGRPSHSAPFKDQIQAACERGFSAQRIYQDLVLDHQFAGSYQSVKRFIRQLEALLPLPSRRMECAAGDEAQVDFGQGAWIKDEATGKRRRPHLFRLVLSHSRKGYSEVVWRQNTETFLRCLENAFRALGGVPKTLVVDNLKAAVLRSDWFDPELNPKLSSFCEHYGTVVLPTKPARPEHKGKVEAGVKYVQNNALKGKEFESLNGQNLYLTKWERTVADTRIHGTTRQQVGSFFEGNERAALQPLPDSLFPVFSEAKRKVHRDGYVEVGVTHLIAPIIPLRPTVGKATGATLKSSVTVNGKNVRVKLDGDEGNPLMPGSPGITYTITINFNGTTGRATFSGEHDGFPSYDFYAGRMIRNWSHVQAGTTPRALFPPMDQPFQGGFKTEVCCE